MSLKSGLFFAVIIFSVFSLLLFIQHEMSLHSKGSPFRIPSNNFLLHPIHSIENFLGAEYMQDTEEPEALVLSEEAVEGKVDAEPEEIVDFPEERIGKEPKNVVVLKSLPVVKSTSTSFNVVQSSNLPQSVNGTTPVTEVSRHDGNGNQSTAVKSHIDSLKSINKTVVEQSTKLSIPKVPIPHSQISLSPNTTDEKPGILFCNGTQRDSEVIYWKIVPGDITFESPITPHHDLHHDRYLTFEYDAGGWNNIRMGMECAIVMAHAMGRTLVTPPPQHLYLLHKAHHDEKTGKKKLQLGFEDFFNFDLLKSHKGFHLMSMKEFLAKEAVTGGLKGMFPPKNSSEIWGGELWWYMNKVADQKPAWMGRFLAMPDRPGDFDLSEHTHPKIQERLRRFGGDRTPVFYDEKLQEAHHLHFSAGDHSRLLQHHYAFVFFADPTMQSFYRRFVRDFMRYQDEIQCAGADLIAAVRADALSLDPTGGGRYYALHVRRGDFQFKDVKIEAKQIVKNLNSADEVLIPRGSLVYLSTDDPDGVCVGCRVMAVPCEDYPLGKKPVGCPVDPSWKAFEDAGWTIRKLDDYIKQGALKGVNPNYFGMVESIVCSRAKVFAGTWFSTFTGYIHRIRGYHGLGEDTYYHSTGYLNHLRMKKSVGHGFSREWRAGWTDDGGELI